MLFSENPDQLIDELKDYIQIASSTTVAGFKIFYWLRKTHI